MAHENQILFDFIKDLIMNNNREWFKAHRDYFDAAWKQFHKLTENAISEISKFDPEIAHLQPSDCIYRIYRDMRFSQDKTPYKGHLGSYISKYGKKSYWGGYYIQIEPEQVMLAGGVWYLPAKEMTILRQSIYEQMPLFESIVENEDFKKHFPVIGFNHFKRLPRNFPKDTTHPEYLTCKDYTTYCTLKPEELCAKNYAEKIAKIFKILKPYNDFLDENVLINREEQETMKRIVKII